MLNTTCKLFITRCWTSLRSSSLSARRLRRSSSFPFSIFESRAPMAHSASKGTTLLPKRDSPGADGLDFVLFDGEDLGYVVDEGSYRQSPFLAVLDGEDDDALPFG